MRVRGFNKRILALETEVRRTVQAGDITLDDGVSAWPEFPTGWVLKNGFIDFFGMLSVEGGTDPSTVRLMPLDIELLPFLAWGGTSGQGWSLGYPTIVHNDHLVQANGGRMSALFAGYDVASNTLPGLYVWDKIMVPDTEDVEGGNLPLPYDDEVGGEKFNISLHGLRWQVPPIELG